MEVEYQYMTGYYQVIWDPATMYYYYATLDQDGDYMPTTYRAGIDIPQGFSPGIRRSAERMLEIEEDYNLSYSHIAQFYT